MGKMHSFPRVRQGKAQEMSQQLTQEYLKSIINYNPETGVFLWKIRPDVENAWNGRYAGTSAGAYKDGYKVIRIHRQMFRAHRLAWLYVYGYLPKGDLDHIDGNRANNKISNLREATRSQNSANSRKSIKNTSGFKGVYYRKDTNKWSAYIGKNGKRTILGCFDCPAAAHFAYVVAANKLHGDFARTA